jgi:hypothetical protein
VLSFIELLFGWLAHRDRSVDSRQVHDQAQAAEIPRYLSLKIYPALIRSAISNLIQADWKSKDDK